MLPHQELTFWSPLLSFSSSERHGKWKHYQRVVPSKVNQNLVRAIQTCRTHGWWLLWLYTTSRLRIKLRTSNIGPWHVWGASWLANQTVDCNVSHHIWHCMLLNQVFKWPSVREATPLGCMCTGKTNGGASGTRVQTSCLFYVAQQSSTHTTGVNVHLSNRCQQVA